MNHESMVAAIIAAYNEATPEQRILGAMWYADAYGIAYDVAETTGHESRRVAAAMAHLSPRVRWADNVHRTWQLASTSECDGMSGPRERAQNALLTSGSMESTFGPTAHKTYRFFRNILGDYSVVTVDIWAARVAGVPDADLGKHKVYTAIENAYIQASAEMGIQPAILQAICWVQARGSAV